MICSLKHERAFRRKGIQIIAGIDEAGRGPLAGPVVAAAVILPGNFRHKTLNDSKKLSSCQREEIYHELTVNPDVQWAVHSVDHLEIDRLNILRAMRQAAMSLSISPEHVLIDGRPVRPFPFPHTALVGGDGLSFSIAAASVLAKVTRDRLMCELDLIYPGYEFARHKGYATAIHFDRLRTNGPSPIHRKSFHPVAQAQASLQFAGSR